MQLETKYPMVQNMIKGKRPLREREISLIYALFIVGVTIAIILLVEYYFLAPIGLMEIFLFAYGICFFLITYFLREEISVFWSLVQIGAGIWIGGILNTTLSTDFLSQPSIIFLLVGAFNVCLLLWTSFTLRKDINWVKKLGFVFMGCWIISLVFALLGFIKILMEWLSFLPLEIVLPSGQMRIKASVVVNILKSLFLSSLFNVSERITRIFGKDSR